MPDDALADNSLAALRQSVDRLHGLVAPMGDKQLEAQAYPTEWRVADVLSHIGSAGVIMQERLARGLRGESLPDDFSPAVWDAWNAKSPRAKADDALVADRALLDALMNASADERAGFRFSMGPMEFDFAQLVGLRLNEHTLHTWDVEVAGEPSAALAPSGTALVIDSLQLITRFTGKAKADGRVVRVRTTDPARDFSLTTGPDAVALAPGDGGAPELTLPAEAFIRLVYGRLDPEHTPPPVDGDPALLDSLHSVFPGP
jgi:uncharacterized protein (TIGR03083 family)